MFNLPSNSSMFVCLTPLSIIFQLYGGGSNSSRVFENNIYSIRLSVLEFISPLKQAENKNCINQVYNNYKYISPVQALQWFLGAIYPTKIYFRFAQKRFNEQSTNHP